MKATELVGKMAIRTKHVTYAGGGTDRSHMEEPVKILKATDCHIVYEYGDEFLKMCKTANDSPNIMSYEYCDDNWVDYDELMSGLEVK